MNIAGLNLYRVLYLSPPVEIEFQKLVVARDEREARFLVPGQFKVELIESDISMVVTEDATMNAKRDLEIALLRDALERAIRRFESLYELEVHVAESQAYADEARASLRGTEIGEGG